MNVDCCQSGAVIFTILNAASKGEWILQSLEYTSEIDSPLEENWEQVRFHHWPPPDVRFQNSSHR